MDSQRFIRGGATPAEESASITEPQVQAIVGDFGERGAPVAIIAATREERVLMEDCGRELTTRGIDFELHELSPHRNPVLLARFVDTAPIRGIRVIIATAGTVPSLPAMVASFTEIPVIGVPLSSTALNGMDTLMATAQAAPGTPVACMCVDGIRNSAIYASKILSAIPRAPGDGE
jgi:5-(carboxyamino)imidazole ribonucleotide mutase